MRKPLEDVFFLLGNRYYFPDVIWAFLQADLIQSEKQALATINKWDRKGWTNYGVSLRGSWIEPQGLQEYQITATPEELCDILVRLHFRGRE